MFLLDELGLEPLEALLIAIGVIAVLVLIILILLIVQMVKHRRLKRKYLDFMGGAEATSLEKEILSRFREMDEMKDHMDAVNQRLDDVDKALLQTFKKMAIRKYDAFQEMGGQLSFVLVLLTERNDGCIINSMHSSREGCYTYIKIINSGKCEAPLSEEENEALMEAIEK